MIISKTPMRMSFAGGGSDLREYYKNGFGAVLSTSIDKYIYISSNKIFRDIIRVSYSTTEHVNQVKDVQHNLVRESLIKVGINNSLDITYMSDLFPAHEGSGLGSSSSLTVGTLHSLYALKEKRITQERLAQEACEIEIDTLGNPIGKQDQYAVSYGGLNFIRFNSNESVTVEKIDCSNESVAILNSRLLAFHTNLKSTSSDILTEQKEQTKNKLSTLNKMVELAEELANSLKKNDLNTFGEILHEGWLLKKALTGKISNDTINELYNAGIEAGASGGKILGSGGGGFLLFYCKEDKQHKLRKVLSKLQELEFNLSFEGSKIIYSD